MIRPCGRRVRRLGCSSRLWACSSVPAPSPSPCWPGVCSTPARTPGRTPARWLPSCPGSGPTLRCRRPCSSSTLRSHCSVRRRPFPGPSAHPMARSSGGPVGSCRSSEPRAGPRWARSSVPSRSSACARCCWPSRGICAWCCCDWPLACRRFDGMRPRAGSAQPSLRASPWRCSRRWPTGWGSGS